MIHGMLNYFKNFVIAESDLESSRIESKLTKPLKCRIVLTHQSWILKPQRLLEFNETLPSGFVVNANYFKFQIHC